MYGPSLFDTDAPLSSPSAPTLRHYQEGMVSAVLSAKDRGLSRVLYVSATGTGKCLGRDTPVLMFDGTVKPVQEVVTGDLLMGADSSPRRVISTCSGSEMMYRVTPTKGDSYIVNQSHILSLKMTGTGKKSSDRGGIRDVSVLDYLSSTTYFKHCAKGWRTGVEFSYQKITLDPYILGVWLGDGASRGSQFTNVDQEVIESLREYATSRGMAISESSDDSRTTTYSLSGGYHREDGSIRRCLQEYGLLKNKHIPQDYKANTRAIRLQVLAGIVDTDGYLTKGCYDLVLKQCALANDVAFIVRSLGMAAYVSPCKKTCTNTGAIGDYFRISISGDIDQIPVRVSRRKACPRRQKKSVLVTGIKIQPIGTGEYFGFEIDGDRRFLLGDFTVTHNTVTFSEIIRRVRRNDPRPALVIAHREELLSQAKSTLERMLGTRTRIDFERGPLRASPYADIVVASVATIAREGSDRLAWLADRGPSVIIRDKAHHCQSEGDARALRRFGAFDGRSFLVGCTATPHRMDNRSLVGVGGAATFEECVYKYELLDAIREGYLCDMRGFVVRSGIDLSGIKTVAGDYAEGELARRVNDDARTELAIKHWRELAEDRPTIVFCASVEHSEAVATAWCAHGYKAESISGGTRLEERQAILKRFKRGQTQILTNCNIATEGFDYPATSCVMLLRPTKSWSLYSQMAGRGTRLSPDTGKTDCLLIDVVDACDELSLMTAPRMVGLPPGVDMQGKSIVKARADLDAIGERAKHLPALPGIWDEMLSHAKEVNLFAPPTIPTPFTEAGAKLRWFLDGRWGAESYTCSCGNGRDAYLKETPLGWHAAFTAPATPDREIEENGETFIIPGSTALRKIVKYDHLSEFEDVIRAAEGMVIHLWPDCGRLAGREQKWVGAEPTEAQLKMVVTLSRIAKDPIDPTFVKTKGDASAIISQLMRNTAVKAAQSRRKQHAQGAHQSAGGVA